MDIEEKRILIIQHVENEGPGIIEPFFSEGGWDIQTIRLYKGELLPDNLDKIAGVVMLGGPMNAYEEEEYPFLKDEDIFISKVIVDDIPFLGLCLGAQLLAKACGAKVIKAPRKELGWYTVSITDVGKRDLLFQGVTKQIVVFQWHEDTFELPNGGVLIAESSPCLNQAFRVGNKAYGLQFHIEVTEDMVKDWVADSEIDTAAGSSIVQTTDSLREVFQIQGQTIIQNFKRIVESSARFRRIVRQFIEDSCTAKRTKCIFWWEKETDGNGLLFQT